MRKFILPLTLGCVLGSFHAPLRGQNMEVADATTPPFTPENLITNIFLGQGVEVLDVDYQGNPAAVGFFKNGLTAVGIERGILLTSGRAASQTQDCSGVNLGADCSGNDFASNQNGGGNNEPDLAQIAGNVLNDVAKYTITFIPTADTLRFKYVFASEEYPDFSCSVFNDVFGFFISGPGLNGPFENNGVNIALIPGTTTPVSINNIHPAFLGGCLPANDQYYNDNTGSAVQPVYNGYLTVFTAEAVVTPCETYTIKLAVCDVGDAFYDTGVFLEAKSFGTGAVQVKQTTLSADGSVAEGCAEGTFSISLPNPAAANFPLDYTIIGTAQPGVDYQTIPQNLFIPQGDSVITVPIVPFSDPLLEGLESIGLDIQRDICNRDTFWIFIQDNRIVPPDLGNDPLVCEGDSISLDGVLPVPLPDPLTFHSSTQDTVIFQMPAFSSIQVAGVQPTILGPNVIREVCVNVRTKFTDDLDLFLISPGGQFVELSSDNGGNCDNFRVCFSPTATTKINYGFPWPPCTVGQEPPFNGGVFEPEGEWADLWDGENPTNGVWQLLALDDQLGFDATILDWSITFEPVYRIFYEWSPSTGLSCSDCPSPVASPTQTTTYTLTASDSYGCTVQDEITVTVEPALEAPNVSCSSVSENSITFGWDEVPNAAGYEINTGNGWTSPSGTLTHVVNGLSLNDTISIAVMALGDCPGEATTLQCFTPNCSAPALVIDNQSNATCNGSSNGSLTVSASGGAGSGYQYQLGQISNTTGVFTGLPAGVYAISVVDALNCANTLFASISQPDTMRLFPVEITPISCAGSNDGSVTVQVQNAQAPFDFIWSDGQSTPVATNLSAGPITVTVTDVNGCTASVSHELSEPEAMSLQTVVLPATCFGYNNGSASVLVGGGASPYSYLWSPGNQTNPQATDLNAGAYTVVVTDANGCTATAVVSITQPDSAVNVTIQATSSICFDATNGSATATATGGISPYNFLWSNGQNLPTASSLTGGIYIVTATDAMGCTGTSQTAIAEQDSLSISLSQTPPLCNNGIDGSATIISISQGGTSVPVGSVQILWSAGNQTTPTIYGLTGGESYVVTVTNASGCSATAGISIANPPAITANLISVQNVSCNAATDGEATVSGSGGTPPYIFQWDASANDQNTATATGLAAGDYSVSVADANDCSAILQVTIEEPAPIHVSFSAEPVSCFGFRDGATEAAATGGNVPYLFNWSNGETGPQLDSLFAGDYSLTLTDAQGCSTVAVSTVTQPDSALTAIALIEDVSCTGRRDGKIFIHAFGGTAPYQYRFGGEAFLDTPSKIALEPGEYAMTIRDKNGCETSLENLQIEEPLPLQVDLGPDTIVWYDAHLFLYPELLNGWQADSLLFEWSSNNPEVTPVNVNGKLGDFFVKSPASVTLKVSNGNGCSAEDLINIFVREFRSVRVPTGFTPNDDGVNSLLHVHGSSLMVEQIKVFRIFDRWGTMVYESGGFDINDTSTGWDGTFKGKALPPGVYVWYLEVDFVDGTTESYKGHTTLIR
jgi:gliding motility-associated-like protein